MEKKALNNNFDDIEIKKINYFNSSLDKDNDGNTKKDNIISNFQNSLSIMDKMNNFPGNKLYNNQQFEERKNTDFEYYRNLKNNRISISNINVNNNIDKNNINEILNENKTINKINNNLDDIKTKTEFDYSKNINNIYLTMKNNNISNKEKVPKNNTNIFSYKNGGKTIFNYNDEYQNKIGEKDNYLSNNEKFNEESYILKDNKNKNILSNPLRYTQNYTLEKKETNLKYESLSNFNTKVDINSNSKFTTEMTKEYKPPSKTNYNSNKLVDSKEYNFNYRSNDSFNSINQKGIEPNENKLEKKTNNYSNINLKNNNILNNEYLSKSNNENIIKSNNYLNNNNLYTKNNKYLFNNDNKFCSPLNSKDLTQKERDIKIQIENEEKKLKILEEEKNQLLKEEKERRDIINEINKRENIYNNEQVAKTKKEENQIKSMTPLKYNNYNSNINDNFYKDFLNKIGKRSEIINQNPLDRTKDNLIDLHNYEKIKTNITPKKKSLSVVNKQIEIKDYIKNFNSNYNTKDYKSNINIFKRNNNIENEYNLYKNKKIYETEKKENANSDFKLNDKMNNIKDNIINNNLYYGVDGCKDKTKNGKSSSSYINEIYKDNNELITKNNGTKTTKNCQIYLTPYTLYRNHNTDNNLSSNNNLRATNYDNLLNNNKDDTINMRDEIVKTFSTNNYNSMTQTRFYRNRAFPELKYNKENLITSRTMKDYYIKNYTNDFKKQNSSRSFSQLNFDLDQDYLNNEYNYNKHILNSQNNILINNYNTLSNNERNNNNLYQNNKYKHKLNTLNTCKCKCTLRKGRSYNDINKLLIENNKDKNSTISLINNFNINRNNDFEISSNIIKRNNYSNLTYNNSFNYLKGSHRNICRKCNKKHFNNENNGNIANGFRNSNCLRLCNTCKQLINGGNIIKRNNNFLFD